MVGFQPERPEKRRSDGEPAEAAPGLRRAGTGKADEIRRVRRFGPEGIAVRRVVPGREHGPGVHGTGQVPLDRLPEGALPASPPGGAVPVLEGCPRARRSTRPTSSAE
jgi:hypothetical protein